MGQRKWMVGEESALLVALVILLVVEVMELSTDLNERMLSDAILCLIRDSAVPNMAARRRLSSPILFLIEK